MGRSDISKEEIESQSKTQLESSADDQSLLIQYDFDIKTSCRGYGFRCLEEIVPSSFQDGNFTLDYPIDCM